MINLKNIPTLFILAFFLSACGTQVVKRQDPSVVSLEYGYAYASFPLRGKLIVKSSETNAKYEFINEASNVKDWGANGIWLPPGNYRIYSWMDVALEEYPEFRIEQGQITDLGAFIPLTVGGYEFVLLPSRHHELEKIAKVKLEELSSYLRTNEVIKWTSETPPKPSKDKVQNTGLGLIADLLMAYERKVNKPGLNSLLRNASTTSEFFELAKKGSQPLANEVAKDEQGNLYFGADLGQIRIRKTDKSWDHIDTGSIVPVTAVEWFNGMLVAGFDNGKIMVSDQGGQWKQLAHLDGFSVTDIDKTEAGWFVSGSKYANFKLNEAVIFSSTDSIPTNLLEVGRFSPKNNVFIPPVRAEAVNNQYYISVFPSLYVFDTEKLEWKTLPVPGDIHSFHATNLDSTVVAYKAQGVFSKVYISYDSGHTWKQIKRPPYQIGDINFSDSSSGTAFRWKAKAFSVELEFYDYSVEKGEWRYRYSAPQGCARVLSDGDNNGEFCITRGGSILSYANGKWEVEFSSN